MVIAPKGLTREMTQNPLEQAKNSGFGNSIILQGSFLLFFDWIAFSLHRRHSKNELNPLLQRIQPTLSGIGLRLNLDSQSRMIPMRCPIGLTFCPIKIPPILFLPLLSKCG